jgi:hypothetical protein
MKTFMGYINESLKMDQKKGLGNVPMNQDVDYFGFRVQMKPSTFLKLASPVKGLKPTDFMIKHLEAGKPFASPFLQIDLEMDHQYPRIAGHEGRHRMAAIKHVHDDIPVEVHIFIRGVKKNRVTSEMKKRINGGITQERTEILRKPGKLI